MISSCDIWCFESAYLRKVDPWLWFIVYESLKLFFVSFPTVDLAVDSISCDKLLTSGNFWSLCRSYLFCFWPTPPAAPVTLYARVFLMVLLSFYSFLSSVSKNCHFTLYYVRCDSWYILSFKVIWKKITYYLLVNFHTELFYVGTASASCFCTSVSSWAPPCQE